MTLFGKFVLCFVTVNFERDCNVQQLEDVEFVLTSVGWNKYQIYLCILFALDTLILYFVQHVVTIL